MPRGDWEKRKIKTMELTFMVKIVLLCFEDGSVGK